MIWIMTAVVMMSACSNEAKVDQAAGDDMDSAGLVEHVSEIYTTVFQQYARLDSMIHAKVTNVVKPNLDSLYCTADWNQWKTLVNEFDAQQADDGMIGFFDADYWIMGQDWQNLSVSDVQVKMMTDSTATMELNLHNCGSVSAVRLEMAKEVGIWKIDNFIDATNDVNWKANMKEYLTGEKENH